MAEEIMKKAAKTEKAPKVADPVAASMDIGTQEMIQRSHDLGIETVFDRAVTMKPCNIGIQGICCKNCAMGPCRLPLPKSGIEGDDTRKGLCGATPNTVAARNFARMVASGASAHSDHGRSVAEVFLSVARKETEEFTLLSKREVSSEPDTKPRLTKREKEILQLVAEGATNHQIADALFITKNTVKVHMRNIMEKLRVHSRLQAVISSDKDTLIDENEG